MMFKRETRGLGAIGLVLSSWLWKGHHGRLETMELLEGLGLSANRWEKGRKKKKKGEEEDKEVD